MTPTFHSAGGSAAIDSLSHRSLLSLYVGDRESLRLPRAISESFIWLLISGFSNGTFRPNGRPTVGGRARFDVQGRPSKESEARSWSPGRLGFFLAEARRAKSYSLAASRGWAHGLQRRLLERKPRGVLEIIAAVS